MTLGIFLVVFFCAEEILAGYKRLQQVGYRLEAAL